MQPVILEPTPKVDTVQVRAKRVKHALLARLRRSSGSMSTRGRPAMRPTTAPKTCSTGPSKVSHGNASLSGAESKTVDTDTACCWGADFEEKGGTPEVIQAFRKVIEKEDEDSPDEWGFKAYSRIVCCECLNGKVRTLDEMHGSVVHARQACAPVLACVAELVFVS